MTNQQQSGTHVLFVFCFFANFLCFFSRVNLSVAAPALISQGLSEAEMGIILSAFFWGYVLMQIPGGILAERYGGKLVLGTGVFLFSLFSLLTPVSTKVWIMSIMRGLVGVGQGANFPCITNIISRFSKPDQMARMQGFTLSGSQLGIMTSLPVGTLVIAHYGWPSIFYVTGGIGLLWCILFVFTTGNIGSSDDTSHTPIPWKQLIFDRANIGLTLSYFSHNYAAYFFMAWLPTYLMQAHGFSFVSMGIVAIIPNLAAFLFVNVSGWISDNLVKRGYSPVHSRLYLICLGMGCAGITVACVPFTSSPAIAVLLITLCQAFRSISTSAYWALTIDLAGKRAGILSSFMNTSGNFAGVVAPMLSGFVVAYFSSWNLAIYICSVVILVGVIIMIPTVGRKRAM